MSRPPIFYFAEANLSTAPPLKISQTYLHREQIYRLFFEPEAYDMLIKARQYGRE